MPIKPEIQKKIDMLHQATGLDWTYNSTEEKLTAKVPYNKALGVANSLSAMGANGTPIFEANQNVSPPPEGEQVPRRQRGRPLNFPQPVDQQKPVAMDGTVTIDPDKLTVDRLTKLNANSSAIKLQITQPLEYALLDRNAALLKKNEKEGLVTNKKIAEIANYGIKHPDFADKETKKIRDALEDIDKLKAINPVKDMEKYQETIKVGSITREMDALATNPPQNVRGVLGAVASAARVIAGSQDTSSPGISNLAQYIIQSSKREV